MLTSWEALAFFYLRCLSTLQETTQPFYNEQLFTSKEFSKISGGGGNVNESGLFNLFGKPKKSAKEVKDQAEQLISQTRVDLSRILVISFVKVLDRLLQIR